MRHETSLKLHAHWDALRAGRAAPGRDEVDPAAIRGVLASVFILDVGARRSDAAFRLSGTRIDALFGRPLRGTAFHRIWSARSAALAAATLDAALDGGCPAVAAARGGAPGRGALDFELLLLPLDGGRHALGSLATSSTPGWMGLAAAAPLDILQAHDPRTPDRGGFGRRRAALTLHPGGRGIATPAAPRS